MSSRSASSTLQSYDAGAAPGALAERFAIHPLHGPVLLATDGRAPTDAAALAARAVADRLNTRVEVVAVLQPLPLYPAGFDVAVLPPEYEATSRTELHASVCRRLEPVLGARSRWHCEVRTGDPARVIAAYAQERHAGLIVVGTGGHGLVDRFLGEEISLQVVRHARMPVLVVAPHHAGPIRRAVVGVDFSAASIRAAQAALALLEPNPEHVAGGGAAPDGPGRLTLVHARSVLETIPPGLASWTADYDASVALRFSRLLDLLRPAMPDGVTIETRIGVGEIVKCLEETAVAEGADLLAVGTHGPDWVERLFVGSIATSTLRHARRTVLVAPAPSPAERVRLELAVSGQVLLDRPGDWAGALDAFTRRNLGRRVRLEVSGPELEGFVVEAERYRFRGACYDVHDRRVAIMLGDDADRTRHLTHALGHVRSVEIVSERERRDRMLLVEFDDGSAVLTLTG